MQSHAPLYLVFVLHIVETNPWVSLQIDSSCSIHNDVVHIHYFHRSPQVFLVENDGNWRFDLISVSKTYCFFFFVSPCPITIKLDYLSFHAGLVEVMRHNPTQQTHALFWGPATFRPVKAARFATNFWLVPVLIRIAPLNKLEKGTSQTSNHLWQMFLARQMAAPGTCFVPNVFGQWRLLTQGDGCRRKSTLQKHLALRVPQSHPKWCSTTRSSL